MLAALVLQSGRKVGLITNQTGLVGDVHLADLLRAAAGVTHSHPGS
jgi:hypothetical protein